MFSREMQIKTTMGNHHIPIRMAAIQNKQTENNRCCQGCGETETLSHYGGNVNVTAASANSLAVSQKVTLRCSNYIPTYIYPKEEA